MARVHVRAWQAAYQGQIPQDYLDVLDVGQRVKAWAQSLVPGGGEGIYVHASRETGIALVAEDYGEILGIAAVGPSRSSPEEGVGELFMINLVPEAWGRGVGRLLLESAESELGTLGYGEAILWVLATNERARRFYERAGWLADAGERRDESRGFILEEVRYRRSL